MIEFSSSSQENEIYMVDSPFNEDSKITVLPREGRPENLGKWAITGTSIVMQIGWWSISKRILISNLWYQNPYGASIFVHAKPNFKTK